MPGLVFWSYRELLLLCTLKNFRMCKFDGSRVLKRCLNALIAAIIMMHAPIGYAQQIPGYLTDEDLETAAVQTEAEKLFKSGNYTQAHYVYINELAPIGDKFAQYMLGFMNFYGLGVEEDHIRASAWYRLAAERNGPSFVAIREKVLDQFNETELQRSDQVFLELRKKYSDIAVRMWLVRRDFEAVSEVATGSRIGRTSSVVTVVRPRDGGSRSQAHELYQRSITKHMHEHLDHITATLRIPPVDTKLTKGKLEELEERVDVYLTQITDR